MSQDRASGFKIAGSERADADEEGRHGQREDGGHGQREDGGHGLATYIQG